MKSVAELADELQTKRRELGEIFESAEKRDGRPVLTEEQCVEVRKRNAELAELQEQFEARREVEEIGRKNAEELSELERLSRPVRPPFPTATARNGGERKTLGDLITESKAFREYKGGQGPVDRLDVDVKTLMQTSAGWDPEDVRTGKVLLYALQKPKVADLLTRTTTQMSTVLYMEETTHTNNAAETAEGGTYGEAALAFTERSSEVRKIAVFIPVTDEQLEDVSRMRDLINERLAVMLANRLDLQILVGNGVAPNLRGVNNLAGINTQAKGADPVFDALYKGIVKCQTVGFAEPDAIVMNPNDWQDVVLTRTADGIYILGAPGDNVAPRLWGLPVIDTTRQTENTAVVGAWRMHGELSLRRGIEVQISNSHSTYFVEGKQAVRADIRAALIFDRAAAFCTVTGI